MLEQCMGRTRSYVRIDIVDPTHWDTVYSIVKDVVMKEDRDYIVLFDSYGRAREILVPDAGEELAKTIARELRRTDLTREDVRVYYR